MSNFIKGHLVINYINLAWKESYLNFNIVAVPFTSKFFLSVLIRAKELAGHVTDEPQSPNFCSVLCLTVTKQNKCQAIMSSLKS